MKRRVIAIREHVICNSVMNNKEHDVPTIFNELVHSWSTTPVRIVHRPCVGMVYTWQKKPDYQRTSIKKLSYSSIAIIFIKINTWDN